MYLNRVKTESYDVIKLYTPGVVNLKRLTSRTIKWKIYKSQEQKTNKRFLPIVIRNDKTDFKKLNKQQIYCA